jgi:beta-galactosidase
MADFVHPSGDLDGARVLVAPALYMMNQATVANLHNFVARGGVLITTPFVDIVDEHDRFAGAGYAVRLRDIFGCHVIDFDGVLPGCEVGVEGQPGAGVEYLLEEVEPLDGEVVARTSSGAPVLVEHRFGDGWSLHCAGFLNAAGTRNVIDRALELAGIHTPRDLPEHVEYIPGSSGVTLINQSDRPSNVVLGDKELALAPWETKRMTR